LCLQAIHWLRPAGARSWRLLDFGSGSGILSIAAARLGASVEAVEIDPLAIEHARHNAVLNLVEDRVRHSRTLAEAPGRFDLVVANILCDVLLEAAEDLTSRVVENGALALSGLVATDVPRIIARYAPLLAQRRPAVYERGAWRLLSWKVA